MNLVYVLLIENYDALDGYMTSIDVKLFKDENTCIDWINQEAKKQADEGFKMKESFTDCFKQKARDFSHGMNTT